MNKYDYLIVGAGLYGASAARLLTDMGKTCLVIDRRNHIAGNIYTEQISGITVHKYGAHIFHTNDKKAWEFVNRFAEFNNYINAPIANYHGEIYNLPFNMNTFNKLWQVITPAQAEAKLAEQRMGCFTENPQNLEEQAKNLVGADIFEKLIKGYTEKQWGRKCSELPASIINRIPMRLRYDNNYFNARYQGIPIGGYTEMIRNMLNGIDVRLNIDYLKEKKHFDGMFGECIYTGSIDEYMDYNLGKLEYRTLRFETDILTDVEDYQGNAVVNYTDSDTPYTRIIEHKHFEFGTGHSTVITREYSMEWSDGAEPYYPITNKENAALYERYKAETESLTNVTFGGRLGEYKYYDMDAVIVRAFDIVKALIR